MLGSKNKKTRSHLFRDNCGLSVTPAACESDFSAHSLILYRGSQSVNGDLREFSRFFYRENNPCNAGPMLLRKLSISSRRRSKSAAVAFAASHLDAISCNSCWA